MSIRTITERLAAAVVADDPDTGYMILTAVGMDGPEADLFANAPADLTALTAHMTTTGGLLAELTKGECPFCPGRSHAGYTGQTVATCWVEKALLTFDAVEALP